MSLRELFIGTALMTLALLTGKAGPLVVPTEPGTDVGDEAKATEVSVNASYAPIPAPLISEDKAVGAAYYDTLNILTTSNSCSDFFGGPKASVDIFNLFMVKVQKHYFSSSIGMQMSGETTNILNLTTKRAYRLFDNVSINVNGPFYRKNYHNSSQPLPRIGMFEPNTKEVRVLIFLHELGHIVKGADGKWLLPDDGRSDELSRLNSETIENVCREQIKNLSKVESK